jgi:ketosteroid isomerase-like protein
MKTFQKLAIALVIMPSLALAQAKGEMPFTTTSKEAQQALRQCINLMVDARLMDANEQALRTLQLDPSMPMAWALKRANTNQEWQEDMEKSRSLPSTADESAFIDIWSGSSTTGVDALIRKYPNDFGLHLLLVWSINDSKRAIPILENIIKKSPKYAPAHNMLGYYYLDLGNIEKSQFHFDKYISLRPDLANVYDSKGDFFMETGQYEEAAAHFDKSFAMDAKNMSVSKSKAELARRRLKWPSTKSDTETIKGLFKQLDDGFLKKDTEAVVSVFHDQAIELPNNKVANVAKPNIKSRIDQMWGIMTPISRQRTKIQFDGTGYVGVSWCLMDVENMVNEKPNSWSGSQFGIIKKETDDWKILVTHWQTDSLAQKPLSGSDKIAIRSQLLRTQRLFTSEPWTNGHSEKLAAFYADQSVQVTENHRAIVGKANYLVSWQGFNGNTTNNYDLGILGVEGYGNTAVCWGIATISVNIKNAPESQKFDYPWAMIMSKENDTWKILVEYWGE